MKDTQKLKQITETIDELIELARNAQAEVGGPDRDYARAANNAVAHGRQMLINLIEKLP